MIMRWIKKYGDVKLPRYETEGSAAMDIRAYLDKPYRLYPGVFKTFNTALSVELDEGYELQIRPRSGLASKYGITVLNSPGTVDSDYRGEIKVCLINHGQVAVDISNNMRIAQVVIAESYQVFQYVKAVERIGGHGSTGNE